MHSVSVVNFTVILSPLFFFAAMLLFDSLTSCDKRSGTRHVVVSHYSSSSVSRSQQQSVSHSAGGGSVWFTWGRKEEREEEETSDGEKDIYDSDSGEGELHPNVCSFTAWLNNSQESRYMPARRFAGIAGVKVSRSVCVCTEVCQVWLNQIPPLTALSIIPSAFQSAVSFFQWHNESVTASSLGLCYLSHSLYQARP